MQLTSVVLVAHFDAEIDSFKDMKFNMETGKDVELANLNVFAKRNMKGTLKIRTHRKQTQGTNIRFL